MHHPPPAAARAVGVVLCNPLGLEVVRGHRAYRQLAHLLNKARYHVLRFDYFGSGDSGGDAREADLPQWIADIGTAADELKDITGVTKVAFVGLRLGAALALLAGQDRKDVDSVVLWDPVVSGAAYLEELRTMHLEYMAQELGSNFKPQEAPRASEALGVPLTDALVKSLRAMDLTTLTGCSLKSAALIVSQPAEPQRRLRERLTALGVKVSYEEVVSAGWNSDEAMNAALVPTELLHAIVSRLAAV